MAVAFDAVGPSAACQLISVVGGGSWTHTAGAGGGTVVVFLTVGLTGAPAGSIGSFASVTYNSNAMTLLSSVSSDNSTWGGIFCYGITGQASGGHTVAVGTYTPPSGATFAQILGVSLSFTSGASFKTSPTPVFGSAATGSLSFLSTVIGGMCVAGACDGTGAEAVTAGTQRFKLDQSGSNTGNTVGATIASNGATTTTTFTWTSDFFGIVGVEILPVGGAPAAQQLQTHRPGLSRLRHHQGARRQQQDTAFGVPQSPVLNAFAGLATSTAHALNPTSLPYIAGISGLTSADYFVDQAGQPRWMFCDSIWTIVYSAGRSGGQTWEADMDQVVSTRASQGYTAIQCNLLPNNEYVASGLTTWDGIHPFVTGTDPVSGLNSLYWARLDYLLASAGSQRVTMFLNLCMGEDINSGVVGAWTGTQKTAYGTAVAARYLTTPNIVWMMGDDGGTDATTATNIMTGIRSTGDTRPVAFENPQETTSRFGLKLNDAQPWNSSGNIAYNWVYNYAPCYQGVEYAYAEASPILVIRGDGYYYNSDGSPSDKVGREQFWWAVSSGSRGYSWGMSDGGWGAFATGWQANLTMGADEIGTAGDFQNNVFPAATTFLATLPNWQKLTGDVANAFMTAGRGTRAPYQTEGIQNQYTGTPADTYVSGSYATDGSLALIYFSRGVATTVTIDQTKLQTGYTGLW